MKRARTIRFTDFYENDIGSHLMKAWVFLSDISYKLTEYFGEIHRSHAMG